jgi:hypothetical protein
MRGLSKFMHLRSSMYEVGEGVGEFLTEEEKKEFEPLTLPQIGREYIGYGSLWFPVSGSCCLLCNN